MEKEKLFIYRIVTNKDWYLALKSMPDYERDVNTYDELKEVVEYSLEELVQLDEFYFRISSKSAEEKLIHTILNYCGNYLIVNEKYEVYFLSKSDLDIQKLNENEVYKFLNDIVTKLGLKKIYEEEKRLLLDNKDEIVKNIKLCETLSEEEYNIYMNKNK